MSRNNSVISSPMVMGLIFSERGEFSLSFDKFSADLAQLHVLVVSWLYHWFMVFWLSCLCSGFESQADTGNLENQIVAVNSFQSVDM